MMAQASVVQPSSAGPQTAENPPVAAPRDFTQSASDDRTEMAEVGLAGRLLATDPARSLAVVRSCEARFPNGYMAVERRYVGISALFALGRRSEAMAAAQRFLYDHPKGALSQRIRSAMARAASSGG
jgi:hypothetical protein